MIKLKDVCHCCGRDGGKIVTCDTCGKEIDEDAPIRVSYSMDEEYGTNEFCSIRCWIKDASRAYIYDYAAVGTWAHVSVKFNEVSACVLVNMLKDQLNHGGLN